jgi:AcrR family transcriptional regulator
LDAAATALARVGYEKITTRLIAQEAGVNIATLHYHFGSKEALLAEAVRYALTRSQDILREAIESAPTPLDALAAGFDATWEIARERPGVLRYDLVLRAIRDEDAREEITSVYAAYRRMVEGLVERYTAQGGALPPGITPRMLGEYVVSAVDGILLNHLVNGDDEAAKNSLDMVRRHVLSLLGRGGEDHGAP